MGLFDGFENTSSFPFVEDITFLEGITFTTEEHQFVEYGLQQLNKEYDVTAGTEWVHRALIGTLLSTCVEQKITKATLEVDKNRSQQLLKEALDTSMKAVTIYPLPILFYDMSMLAEMIEPNAYNREAYVEFLRMHERFEPQPIDEEFMKRRDIEGAIQDAKAKINEENIEMYELRQIAQLQAQRLVNAHAYIALLMLDDEIRATHQQQFREYILKERPNFSDASQFSSQALDMVGKTADHVSVEQQGLLYVHSLIWNYNK